MKRLEEDEWCTMFCEPVPFTVHKMCVFYRLWFFLPLQGVLEYSETNRMTTQNIGIVFGPTLMRPERDNGNMAVNMVYQNQAVELILTEFDHIFGTRGPS